MQCEPCWSCVGCVKRSPACMVHNVGRIHAGCELLSTSSFVSVKRNRPCSGLRGGSYKKKTNGSMHTVLRGPSVPYIVVGTYKDVSIHGCAPHKEVALYKEVSVYGRVLYKEWLYTMRLTYNDVNIHIANIGTYTSTEHRSHCP